MQNSDTGAPPPYRERLTPSLWLLAAAAVAGPMVALTFLPVGSILALVLGVGATVGLLVAIIVSSPVLSVADGRLRAGRAQIDVVWLGEAIALTGEAARQARGPGLPARGWHLIRGGIDGVVVVENTDPADPVVSWTISTRTPDRFCAALARARG